MSSLDRALTTFTHVRAGANKRLSESLPERPLTSVGQTSQQLPADTHG